MATGTVKSFNLEKGFGFILPDDGGADVFVHISAVDSAGLPGLKKGDRVSFEIGTDRARRSQATALALIAARPSARTARAPGGFERERRGIARSEPETIVGSGYGVVKWFDQDRGYGFIQPHDGREDVFLHISSVERSGLGVSLIKGQAVSYDVLENRRSGKRTATNLRAE